MQTFANQAAREELIGKKFPVLDHGHIVLVDVMGDDPAIVAAARTSYQQGTKKVSDDRTLLRYLFRHRHCYDIETEVLSRIDGEISFRPWEAVHCAWANQIQLDLGIWDPETESLCYERPEYCTSDDFSGQLYQVDHGGVSLAVTPEHSMWVQLKSWDPDKKHTEWSNRWELVPAQTLGDRSMVRYSKVAPFKSGDTWNGGKFPPCDNVAALLQLIGFFIGDGTHPGTRANGIEFHLRKRRKIGYLRCLGVELGWEVAELANDHYVVRAPSLGHCFKEFFEENGDKQVPQWLLALGAEQAESVLIGLRNSDGSQKRGAWAYATSVRKVAEAVQLLALHAGEAAHICHKHCGMHEVMFLSRMRMPVVNQSRRNTALVPYNGPVFCAKTRTGVLVVRRNGKIVLSGNSTPFEACCVKLHVKLPIFVERQWVRHRAAGFNEVSARYSVLPEEFYIPEPDVICEQSGTNKQGRGDTAAETVASHFRDKVACDGHNAFITYHEAIEKGLAREISRISLPLGTYTEKVWWCNLRMLLHFLGLRMDKHAQWEVRQYANIIGNEIVAKLFPDTFKAFEDYHLNALTLSAPEIAVLRLLFLGDTTELSTYPFKEREHNEFTEKLERLGLAQVIKDAQRLLAAQAIEKAAAEGLTVPTS